MFTIFFVNFGYSSQERYATLEAAREAARKACFECIIYEEVVADEVSGAFPIRRAAFSPIGGFRK